MFPYVAATLFVIFLAKTNVIESNQEQDYRLRMFLALLPLMILIAFRASGIGADTYGYYRMFKYFAGARWRVITHSTLRSFSYQNIEIGFAIFCKLLGYISKSELFFQFVTALLYFVTYFRFYIKLKDSSITALIYFATLGSYTFLVTGIRQNIAMCICLWAYTFVEKRKIIPFAALILLAFTFHKSAVLFLPAYFIYLKKNNRWSFLFDLLIAGVLYVNFEVFQSWFGATFDFNYGIDGAGDGLIFFVLITALTVLSKVILLSDEENFTPDVKGIANMAVICNILWALRVISRTAERPAFYYLPFSAALFAMAIRKAKTKDKNQYTFMVILTVLGLAIFVYRLSYNTTITPYHIFGYKNWR